MGFEGLQGGGKGGGGAVVIQILRRTRTEKTHTHLSTKNAILFQCIVRKISRTKCSLFLCPPQIPLSPFRFAKKRAKGGEEEASSSSFRFLRSRLVMDADPAAVGPLSPSFPRPASARRKIRHLCTQTPYPSSYYTGMFVRAPVEKTSLFAMS